jgi:tRNA(Ile)-lysidine synthase
MSASLLESFRLYWKSNKFTVNEKPFLLAASGGVDSMVLADMLLRTSVKFDVAHCNFRLRAGESDADEQLVSDWCKANGIRVHIARFDTNEATQNLHKGIQETARILRYEYFEKLKTEFDYRRIITAHHANDNAETVLMNLFKGTGIRGVHGILPDNGAIIRPLLFADKATIRRYADENNIPFREDASNAKDDYTRNAVRNIVVPAIEQIFPDFNQQINESIRKLSEAEIYFHKGIAAERKKLLEVRGNDIYIPIAKLKLREALPTLVFELLLPYGFNGNQIFGVLTLMESESGHYMVSETHRLIKNRAFLIITALKTEETDIVIVEAAPYAASTSIGTFHFEIVPTPDVLNESPNIAYFNNDKIEFPLILRRRKEGDYLYPFGMNMKKKKISRMLIDLKVPLHEKENIWVLEQDRQILWVAGIRTDERFKVKDGCENVLKVSLVR